MERDYGTVMLDAIRGKTTDDKGALVPVLSLRDYFAAAALTGLVAAFKGVPGDAAPVRVGLTEDAYLIADAMLSTRMGRGHDHSGCVDEALRAADAVARWINEGPGTSRQLAALVLAYEAAREKTR